MNNKYVHIAASGLAGVVNALTIIMFVKSSTIEHSDMLLVSVAIVNFFNILVTSPINASKQSHIINIEVIDERDRINISNGMFLYSLYLTPFIVLFSFLCSFIFLENYLNTSWIFNLILSVYCLVFILFELIKIEKYIKRKFIHISLFLFVNNLFVFTVVIYKDMTVIGFFIISSICKLCFILFYILKISRETNLDDYNIKNHMRVLISKIHVYSFSVLVTATSSLLPSYLLSFFGSGYVTAYQLSLRLINTPISLIVTPFVDFVRYNITSKAITKKGYYHNIIIIFVFCFLYSGIIYLTSDYIGEFLLVDEESVKNTFVNCLVSLLPIIFLSSMYIYNSRLSELNLSLTAMSLIGLSIHALYLALISYSTYISNDLSFIYSKVIVEILFFIVSIYFIRKSRLVK